MKPSATASPRFPRLRLRSVTNAGEPSKPELIQFTILCVIDWMAVFAAAQARASAIRPRVAGTSTATSTTHWPCATGVGTGESGAKRRNSPLTNVAVILESLFREMFVIGLLLNGQSQLCKPQDCRLTV